jgi:hypothetical protein
MEVALNRLLGRGKRQKVQYGRIKTRIRKKKINAL